MDSFSADARAPEPVDLSDVRSQVKTLEDAHRSAGIALSGRVIHVCHYLPVTASLNSASSASLPSPPASPKTSDVKAKSRWTLAPRIGHSAMISGIRSLSATHEQVVIGWTGDIFAGPPVHGASTPADTETASAAALDATSAATVQHAQSTAGAEPRAQVPVETIIEEDRGLLEADLAAYEDRKDLAESTSAYPTGEIEDLDDAKKVSLVPVWLDNKVAHGHYEGYCKTSTSFFLRVPCFVFFLSGRSRF